MLREQGKRVPTLEEFAFFLNPLTVEDDYASQNSSGMVTEPNKDSVLLIQSSPGKYRLLPGPEFCPRLYRGQNGGHQKCIASLYRKARGVDRIYWLAKILELRDILTSHPSCYGMMSEEMEGMTFDFQIHAIAQHYGYPTGLVDFSRSEEVAMFFATCKHIGGDKYEPMNSGEAVLYTAELKSLILSESPRQKLLPLGLEPLPRPLAQRAMALWLSEEECLDDKPWIKRETFEITPDLSRYYFEKFDHGQSLFPTDSFDQFISSLRDNQSVHWMALEFGMRDGLLPAHPEGYEKAVETLNQSGYKVNDGSIQVPGSLIAQAQEEWLKRRETYLDKVMRRGICDHYQED